MNKKLLPVEPSMPGKVQHALIQPGNLRNWLSPLKTWKFLTLLLLVFAITESVMAQVVPPPQYFVTGGTGTNTFPLNTTTTKRSQYLYLPGDLPGATSGNILRIYFRASTTVAASSYSDFRLRLGQTTSTTFPGTGGLDFFTNLTTVITATTFNIAAPAVDGWIPIDLQIPFLYNAAQTLIVEVEMSNKISGGISVRTGTGPSAPNHKRLTASTLTATTGNASTIFHDFGIDVGPSAPCSGPPTAGTTVSSVSMVCPNTNFQLSLTGNTFATGITVQWQSSPNGTTWTNITGATNLNYMTSQTATTFYRAQLTCSGQTTSSVPVQVSTNATPVSGTFTINKNNPTAGTNFNSFADAIASFECGGLNGPITFNVTANTGPYNEQIVIPSIPGTSATNTITFNGNGNTVSALPGANMGVITLDGTDYAKFNNFILTLDASATTGSGVQLLNEANNNTLTNSTINLPLNTTSSSINGIIFGATTSTAANNGNNNIFSNNTINGGYYGIRINGPTGTVGAVGNQITGNTFRDNYIYNIYLSNTEGTLIESNDISRPSRATVSTFYGVFMTGTSKSNIISKNRIYNGFGGVTSSTTTAAYPIYLSSTDAPTGFENIIKNNLIYNITTNGIIYGLYNVGSDGAWYFHNTIDLNNTTNTGTVRGVYQTTAATNIKFQNNIITIGGTTGSKHALYFGTTTSAITSDRNDLFASGTANVGSWGTANQATLAAWRTASAQDANSVSADPIYLDPANGNFKPTNVAVNNIGSGVGVTDDITGAIRSTTTPDPGAYEFSVNANDVGVTSIIGLSSGCGLTSTQTITITVRNFGSAAQSNIPVNFMVNNVVIGTGTIAGPLAPNATATFTFTATANLGAPGPYTIIAKTLMPGDADAANDSFTLNVANSLIPNLPIMLDFETPASGIAAVQVVTNSKSTIVEAAGASNGATSTKGMIMAGITATNWVVPVGVIDPWTNNGDQFSAIKMCINPASGPALDSLFLIFDLKQLFKTAAANTNFRVTVNGTQVGPTYNPPFSGTPIVWKTIRVDLTPYKNLSNVEIALESSVKEEYANGNGTANLIDNLIVSRWVTGLKADLLQRQISVYPNPSTGIFNVTAPKGNYTVEVTDMTGKTVLKQTAAAATSQLNLQKAAKGIYLLKITSEGSVATQRLVIQ